MRVQQARLGLDHGDGLVEGLEGVGLSVAVADDGAEVEAEIGRLEVRREGVAQALLLAGRDRDVIARRRQVLDDARRPGRRIGRPERAADEGHRHGRGLVVLDRQRALRRAPVDQLDPEDLGLRERGPDVDVQGRRFGRRIDVFLDLGRGLSRWGDFFSAGLCSATVLYVGDMGKKKNVLRMPPMPREHVATVKERSRAWRCP